MNTPALVAALLLTQAAPTPAGAAADAPVRQVAPAITPAPSQPAAGPVMTLADALQQASDKNPDLATARARIGQVKEISAKVWANYLPQISLGASYTRNNLEAKIGLPTGYAIRDVGQPTSGPFDPTKAPGIDNPPGAPTTYTLVPTGFAEAVVQAKDQLGAQLQLNQALIAPALWPAIKNASFAVDVAELNVESARRELLFGVAQLYFGCVGLKQAVSVNERLLGLAQAQEKDAQVRFKAGAAPKLALLSAQITRSKAEQDLQRAQNGYRSARVALGALLDRSDDAFEVELPASTTAPTLDGQSGDHALDERFDVKAARANVELAQRNKDAVWFQYAPSLGLSAVGRVSNVKGFAGSYGTWAITLGLNWTLWDGGLRESLLRENESKLAEAKAAQHATEIKTRTEIQRASLELDDSRAARRKAEEQLSLARENAQLTQVNFGAGAATYVEVQNATTQLQAAELGMVAETLNAELSSLKLLKVLGKFAPN